MIDRTVEAEIAERVEGCPQKFRLRRIAEWCAAAAVVGALLMPFVAMAEDDQLSVTGLAPADAGPHEDLSPAGWQQIQAQIVEHRHAPRYRAETVDEGFAASNPAFEKLRVLDADGQSVPASMQLTGQELAYVIDDRQARYPLTIDPTFVQQAYLKASNTDSSDRFGHSVAVSGNTVVVGAFVESSNATGVDGDGSDNSASSSGAAYVFVRSGNTWEQQAYLKAFNTDAGDSFGRSVAISGDTVVVGAYAEDSNATGVDGDGSDNSAGVSGAAYVFVRSGTTWSQQAYLKASNTGYNDGFGLSVSVSDDTVVVGAFREDSSATGVDGNENDNSADYAGAAYVFVRSGSTWSQQAYLKASNTGSYDEFGRSVAVSGDTVVVGAYNEDSNATGVDGDGSDNSASVSGAAYVFVRSGSTWSQQAYLKATNTDSGDRFGRSVAISTDTVLVGAFAEDSNATGVDGDGSDNSAAVSGAAYVFVRSGGTWTQQGYLKASNSDSGDAFGRSVAISGDTMVVGAYGESSNATGVDGDGGDNSVTSSGAAYLFVRSGSTWTQQAYLKASNIGSSDQFGFSVAVSGDTVAVGAWSEDSNATGVNGDGSDNSAANSGAVYVFGVPAFTVGGDVTGLAGSGLVLQNNGTDDLPISSNGPFEFDTALPDGSNYEVTVVTQPTNPNQTCTVSNGAGQSAGADVTNVEVTCTTDSYTVTTTATNGVITSIINPMVEWGQSTTVAGQADANHFFASVNGCDGVPQTNTDQGVTTFSYQTGAIEADCAVSAEFSIRTYSISSTVSSGQGAIDVLTPVVNHGNDANFDVIPDAGWSLQSLMGDTCTPTDNGDGTWTATNITADCQAAAGFIEETTSVLIASMSPAIVGMTVTYQVSVTGTASAPADGQIELVSDLDGVICTIIDADAINGETATFSCQHTWTGPGEHQLSATFYDSATHDGSGAQFQQTIVASEEVFRDRFQSE